VEAGRESVGGEGGGKEREMLSNKAEILPVRSTTDAARILGRGYRGPCSYGTTRISQLQTRSDEKPAYASRQEPNAKQADQKLFTKATPTGRKPTDGGGSGLSSRKPRHPEEPYVNSTSTVL